MVRERTGLNPVLPICIVMFCSCQGTKTNVAHSDESVDDGYGKWLNHRDTILKDSALIEYFDFEAPGFPFKNKALKPDAALRDGAMKHSPVKTQGRWPGKTALYFNRMSYIETTNLPFGFKDAMTIEVWLKPTANKPWSYVYTDWGRQDHSFELAVPEGKILYSVSPVGNARGRATVIGKTVMTLDKWHHITATFDKGLLRIYLDGKLEGSVKGSFTTIHNPVNDSMVPLENSIPRRISHANTRVPMHPFIGYIDEFAVYGRALSEEEVAARYRDGRPAAEKEAVKQPVPPDPDVPMDKEFFSQVFPAAKTANMATEEAFSLYDGELPKERKRSSWGLYGDQHTVKEWMDSISERTVYHSLLRHQNHKGRTDWELGIGKGGQLYSIRGPWGEAIPPQFMPWTDEVWQATSFCEEGVGDRVRILQSKYHVHGIGEGFVHQSGTNSNLLPPGEGRMFYSPMLARWYDKGDKSYSVLNWGQTSNLPTLFLHRVLYYTRYRYLGDGVIEVTNSCFNFGDYTYGCGGIPWGGVRTTVFPHLFISKPDGSHEYIEEYYGSKTCFRDVNSTGGWLGAAAKKDDPGSMAFGFVYGRAYDYPRKWREKNKGRKITGQMALPPLMSFGRAGRDESRPGGINTRDFTVTANSVRGEQRPGGSYWVRYYLILGSAEDVARNAREYEKLADYGDLDLSEEQATLQPLYSKKSANGSVTLTRTAAVGTTPVCHVYNEPLLNSKPLFRIEEMPNGRSVISTDPYEISHREDWRNNQLPKDHKWHEEFNNRKACLPYQSQSRKPLKWTLLGFVMPDDQAKLEKDKYLPIQRIVSVPEGSKDMLLRR